MRLATVAFSAAVAALALLAAPAVANVQMIPPRLRGGKLYRDLVAKEQRYQAAQGWSPNTTANTLDLPVDWNDASKGTFKDYYYYDTTFWDKNYGPCIMYLNGEGPLESSIGGYVGVGIANGTSACTLAIEHRWYGSSLPGAITDKALIAKTLNIEQAMQDIVALMKHFEKTVAGRNLTWMLIGGSYSGAMTVWMNEKYPTLFKTSWAASAVVRATFGFTGYFGHVEAVTPPSCSNKLQYFNQLIESMLADPAGKQKLYATFSIAPHATTQDVLLQLAGAVGSLVQYSQRTFLCSSLPDVNTWDVDASLLALKGLLDETFGPGFFNGCYTTACLSNTSNSAEWGMWGYSWMWQTCSEFAWFYTGYPGSKAVSPSIDLAYFVDKCRAVFFPGQLPDTWAFNEKWHGLQPQTPAYIVATQGSDDPWSTTGMSKSPSKNIQVNTAHCADCGHCGSMMSPTPQDPQELVEQREFVYSQLVAGLVR